MQLEQSGISRFIGQRTGMNQNSGNPYFRLTVADEQGQIMQIYCSQVVYERCKNLEFGHELQLVFNADQWRSGIHLECIDCVVTEKKR